MASVEGNSFKMEKSQRTALNSVPSEFELTLDVCLLKREKEDASVTATVGCAVCVIVG